MIQLSDFFNTHSCSFWNGSVWLEPAESAAGRVVLLQLLSIHDGAVGVTNLGVMLLCERAPVMDILNFRLAILSDKQIDHNDE